MNMPRGHGAASYLQLKIYARAGSELREIASSLQVEWHRHGVHISGYGAMRNGNRSINRVDGQDDALRMEMARAGAQENANEEYEAI